MTVVKGQYPSSTGTVITQIWNGVIVSKFVRLSAVPKPNSYVELILLQLSGCSLPVYRASHLGWLLPVHSMRCLRRRSDRRKL